MKGGSKAISRTAKKGGMRSSLDRMRGRRPPSFPKLPRTWEEDTNLPFADPSDVVDVGEQLFSADDIKNWVNDELESNVLSVLEFKRKKKEERAKAATVIERRSKLMGKEDPAPAEEAKPKQEPEPARPAPPAERPKLRTAIPKPFAAPVLSAAPAARSGRRFTEPTALELGEGPSRRWPEIVVTIVVLVIAIWAILKL